MKKYEIVESSNWSVKKLKEEAEQILNDKSGNGYEIVSVSFGVNAWRVPTVFITIRK
jgi:hypothetical protein